MLDAGRAIDVDGVTSPLTLADMREQGVHSVSLYCECGHSADVNVDHLPGHIPAPEVWRLFQCSKCQGKPYQSMPLWKERGITPPYPA